MQEIPSLKTCWVFWSLRDDGLIECAFVNPHGWAYRIVKGKEAKIEQILSEKTKGGQMSLDFSS